MPISPSNERALRTFLDCRGLACPVPIVRISRAMKSLVPGQTLHVQANDDAFVSDLDAWLHGRADKLISLEVNDDCQAAVIQKSE